MVVLVALGLCGMIVFLMWANRAIQPIRCNGSINITIMTQSHRCHFHCVRYRQSTDYHVRRNPQRLHSDEGTCCHQTPRTPCTHTVLPSQRIFPEPAPIVLVRRREPKKGPAVAEMGVYATFFGTGEAVLQSKVAGFLLRTKVCELMCHSTFCQLMVVCLSSSLK